MGKLRKDGFSRPTRVARQGGRRGSASLFILLFLSFALLVLSRVENKWISSVRLSIVEHIAPMLEATALPAAEIRRVRNQVDAYVDLFAKLEELKRENQRLKQWEWRARQLEAQVSSYRRLLNGVEQTSMRFATGRVIADGRSALSRTALTDIGRRMGVQEGNPVVNGDGLVGRIVDVRPDLARIILLSDPSSRIPVRIGEERIRGVVIGDNSARPRIELLSSRVQPKADDIVYTSGEGGLFPAGLQIGQVTPATRGYRVQLRANLGSLDFVSVLFYTGPDLGALERAEAVRTARK